MGYNVFAEMGFENPAEELLKSHLVTALRDRVTEKQLTHEEVASLWNLPPSEIASLLRGRWEDYSVEQLYRFNDALSRNVNVRRLIVNCVPASDEEETRPLAPSA